MITGDTAVPSKSDRLLRVSLWVAQIFIFLSFVPAGAMKLFMPIPELASIWAWAGVLPASFVRILGVIDIAGGMGVVLPALTRIQPRLTVLAALGCAVLQIFAMIFHASRGEISVLPVNVVMFALAVFIVWGRRKAPIQPR